VEGGINLFRRATPLVDLGDSFLEINTRLDCTEDLVARAEDALEELEFLRKQLEDTLIGLILQVEEIDHDHVVSLAIAVAASDSLLNPLWVPRQIVVDDKGTELKVDAFGTGFCGYHDLSLVTEVIHESRAHVGSWRAGDAIRPFISLDPFLVNFFRAGIVVGAIEENEPVGPRTASQHATEIILCATRFSEDDRFLFRPQALGFGKSALQGGQ